ncbi:MAG: hypothetical protein RSD19_04100, partial [Oscillospiraceae bacterium]
ANARSIKDRDAADKALTEARELFFADSKAVRRHIHARQSVAAVKHSEFISQMLHNADSNL